MRYTWQSMRPWLITVPAYLSTNWERELAIWAPGHTVANAVTSTRRDEVINADASFVLVSYHMWNRHASLFKRHWTGFVFDEAHRLRGHSSAWTKRVFQLQNAESRNRDARFWFLTGTPLVRDAGDLWPFLHLMDRQRFSSYWKFVEEHCFTNQTPWVTEVEGVKDPHRFAQVMAEFSVRRLLKDIPELAHIEHVDKVVELPLPASVAQAIRKARKEYVFRHDNEIRVYQGAGDMIQDLLQMCSTPPTKENPKLAALNDYLQNDAPNERVVVFTWYRKTAETVTDHPRVIGTITGDTPLPVRDRILDSFRDSRTGVLVANIAAAGSGLNLQVARRCVFIEESELESENEQAIGRLKRRGQAQVVLVHRFLTSGLEMVKHRRVVKRDRHIRQALLEYLLDGDAQ
jgi:SNF2 family DNA or RNA helicase